MLYKTHYASPVGQILLASTGASLIGLWIEGQQHFAASIAEEMFDHPELPVFQQTTTWLDRYFSLQKPDLQELPLAPVGNVFRQAVWKILCAIPYGETSTYGAVAREVATHMGIKTMSAQAVGGAIGHNPISIIIPCHRVVGTNGNLTGYAGGIDLKLRLLAHEGVDTSRLFLPRQRRLTP